MNLPVKDSLRAIISLGPKISKMCNPVLVTLLKIAENATP